jgi:hypothetical protein
VTSGPVRVADTTGWVEADGVVYVAALPDGPPLVLDGHGAVVWGALVPGGSVDDVTARVAATVGESAAVVGPDVARFVGSLVDAGVVAQG